jgi:hypothetical protein
MIIDLLKQITDSLENKSITYMLSGGLALSAYSIPRMTLDIDLIVELHPQNTNDFLSIFDENFYLNSDVVKTEVLRTGMFNAIDQVTGFKIDFIVRKNSEYRINEFKRRRKAKIADLDLWIVAAEDLVISKIDWIQQYQSDKQIEDIKNLLSLHNIDYDYIKHWCNKLRLKTFNLLDNV